MEAIQVTLRFDFQVPGSRLGADERESLAAWILDSMVDMGFGADVGFPADYLVNDVPHVLAVENVRVPE